MPATHKWRIQPNPGDKCQSPGCDAEAIVGWGPNRMMLCQAHFTVRLAKIRKILDAFGGLRPDKSPEWRP